MPPASLERYTLDYHWQHILIIPVLDGFALESVAWIIPTSLLLGDSDQEILNSPLLRLLQPIPAEQVQQLGLEVISASTTKSFKELTGRLGGIQYHFTHLGLFAEHVPYLDEVGRRVLENYLKKSTKQLRERFDGLQTLMIEVTQQVRQAEIFPQEALGVLLAPIEGLIKEIEDSRGQTVTIGLEECQAKAEQFQEIAQAVGILQFSMLPGIQGAGAKDILDDEPSNEGMV